MKKFFTMMLLAAMLFMIAACGSNTDTTPSTTAATTPAATTTTAPPASTAPPSTAPATTTTATTKAPETIPDAPAKPLFNTTLWRAEMPDAFVRKEDTGRDEEDYTSLTFEYRKDASSEKSDATLNVLVSLEERPRSFRRSVGKTIAELKNYANGVDTVKIGGINFIENKTTSWGEPVTTYRGRDESSTADISIAITGEIDENVLNTVLTSFELTAPDIGHKDPPWPWDGVRFEPVIKPIMSGSFTITPEYIASEEPIVLSTIMASQIAAVGDSVYAVTNSEMGEWQFTDDKTGLTLIQSKILDEEYEYISCDNAGNLYMSPGLNKIIVMNGFEKVFQSSLKHDLSVHPSGTWGISFWVNSDPMKVTIGDGVMGEESWVLKNLNKDEEREGAFRMISQITVNDKHIIVAGKHVKSDSEAIVVYDLSGKELFMLANTDGEKIGLGSITGVVETENGFLATDGNMREINLWNKSGEFIGDIRVKDLFGASYCWLEDMQQLADGSIMVAISQTREDSSADELLFFRLTGF